MKSWKRVLLIGIIIALTSQLYWSLFVEGFRISASVILLPVLIMTLAMDIDTLLVGSFTGVTIYIFRVCLALFKGTELDFALLQVLPNALFYICYGIIFHICIRNKHTVKMDKLILVIFACDFGSNLFEMAMQTHLRVGTVGQGLGESLLLIALIRTAVAGVIILGEKQYRVLLRREEHEIRYQKLFLMTTGLKNEVYFMKKNSEEVESVMSNAYRLYEKLSELDVSDEMTRMSLSIARDVHEIKKDYIRIIQGIEEAINQDYDEESMSLHDLLLILKDSTYHILEPKNLDIHLDFQCTDDFLTKEHYTVMAILKNLVNNAIEAIESDKKRGCIQILEERQGDRFVFWVKDDGPGILKKHLDNIFQMGYSTKFDYKTGNIYRGVGLCGVKIAVEEQMRGNIFVESEKGVGTEFRIELPAEVLEDN